jgi:hypothetical protein
LAFFSKFLQYISFTFLIDINTKALQDVTIVVAYDIKVLKFSMVTLLVLLLTEVDYQFGMASSGMLFIPIFSKTHQLLYQITMLIIEQGLVYGQI